MIIQGFAAYVVLGSMVVALCAAIVTATTVIFEIASLERMLNEARTTIGRLNLAIDSLERSRSEAEGGTNIRNLS